MRGIALDMDVSVLGTVSQSSVFTCQDGLLVLSSATTGGDFSPSDWEYRWVLQDGDVDLAGAVRGLPALSEPTIYLDPARLPVSSSAQVYKVSVQSTLRQAPSVVVTDHLQFSATDCYSPFDFTTGSQPSNKIAVLLAGIDGSVAVAGLTEFTLIPESNFYPGIGQEAKYIFFAQSDISGTGIVYLGGNFTALQPGRLPVYKGVMPSLPPLDSASDRTVRFGVLICDKDGNVLTLWSEDVSVFQQSVALDSVSQYLCDTFVRNQHQSLTAPRGPLSPDDAFSIAATLEQINSAQVLSNLRCWEELILQVCANCT